MINHLVTFGCSFTYGSGLSDCITEDGSHGPIASEQAWPSILGKLTGMKVDNASACGSSNVRITKAVVDYPKYTKQTVVVIFWTNPDRETIYTDRGEEKLHMLPRFADRHMPRSFWFDKDKNNFKKTVKTYYEDYHEDWNAAFNQVIRMNYIHAFLKDKGIRSLHLQGDHYINDIEDKKYFKKLYLKDLEHKQFNWKHKFHIDDALDRPNPHPGPNSHKLMADNINNWYFK